MATISVDMIPPDIAGIPWRKADVDECLDLGMPIEEAVNYSMNNSNESYAIRFDGQLVCCWGYSASPLGIEAQLWMLSTVDAENWKYRFARSSFRVVTDLLQRYPVLSCQVAMRHRLARQWLSWLGFVERSREGKVVEMVVTRETVLWAF